MSTSILFFTAWLGVCSAWEAQGIYYTWLPPLTATELPSLCARAFSVGEDRIFEPNPEQCLDTFESVEFEPSAVSPSGRSYLWLGQPLFSASMAIYVIQPDRPSRKLQLPDNLPGSYPCGLIAMNDTDNGFLTLFSDGSIRTAASNQTLVQIPGMDLRWDTATATVNNTLYLACANGSVAGLNLTTMRQSRWPAPPEGTLIKLVGTQQLHALTTNNSKLTVHRLDPKTQSWVVRAEFPHVPHQYVSDAAWSGAGNPPGEALVLAGGTIYFSNSTGAWQPLVEGKEPICSPQIGTCFGSLEMK